MKNLQLAISNIKWEELRSRLKGDLEWGSLYKGLYATDASNYQIIPLASMAPACKEDLSEVLEFAKSNKLSLLPRGGGTSLVGQTVGESIVIDFTKYMNKVLDCNPMESWAIVEPGVIRDELNLFLLEQQLHFAPDPATTSRAAIGGMIANNSSGTRSILYGKTLDHVIELEVLLEDGSIIICNELNGTEIESKLQLESKEGELYRGLFNLIGENRHEIEERFPKVMRRVGGYNLDEFLESKWNLSKIFVGSEGTLGIILSAKIKLVPNPKFQCLCVVHFNSFYESIAHIQEMVKFSPASVELLSELLLEKSKENLETKRYCDFLVGTPNSVQVVEFYGETLEEAVLKAEKMCEELKSKSIGYAYPIYTEKKRIESIFTLRKKGLGLLMGVKGNRKPIAFIEDAAVPLEHLANYIMEVFEVCRQNDTPVVAYAHSSVGLLHVKPLLDLRDGEDIERMKRISDATLELVMKYKGSWSGEHGDGLARGPYNEKFFGKKLYQAFVELKNIFDPQYLFNPGKIINTPKVDSNLRYGIKYKDNPFQSKFNYRSEGGFLESVHLCNGVGECRKMNGGTMCPSFRATRDEKDSTRGRANILRLAMSGQLDELGLESKALEEVMELCLSCKACKSECPSNVDMSKLKSEINYFQKKNKRISASDFLIKNQIFLSKLSSGFFAPVVNSLLSNRYFKNLLEKIANIDSRRTLPKYTSKPFTNINYSSEIKENTVVLFADTYIKYHEPNIGISAKALLEYLDYHVIVFQDGCCQRPAISKGLLNEAYSNGEMTLKNLEPYLSKNVPVLVCEPSCATSLKDDLTDLMTEDKWQNYSSGIFLFEDFLMDEKKRNKLKKKIKIKEGKYLFHGHCHQKAIFTTNSVHQIFKENPESTMRELDTGCCGMAGSFGYETKNYNLSEKLANINLVPEINREDHNTVIIAQGFSCRHQIEHFSHRQAIHWLEAVDLNS
ncbi:MAG: FAD-linked oxidase C-terminal domain-containing protein [Saprospiraceae bacterium]